MNEAWIPRVAIQLNCCSICEHWKADPHVAPDTDDVLESVIEKGEPWDPTVDQRVAALAVAAAQAGRWGKCARITHGWGDSERAYTMDSSHYASSLRTRDDFGCHEWAPTNERRPA